MAPLWRTRSRDAPSESGSTFKWVGPMREAPCMAGASCVPCLYPSGGTARLASRRSFLASTGMRRRLWTVALLHISKTFRVSYVWTASSGCDFEHCILICHMSYYNYNCILYCAIFYLNIIRFFSLLFPCFVDLFTPSLPSILNPLFNSYFFFILYNSLEI